MSFLFVSDLHVMHSVVPDHMFQYLGRTIFFLQSLYDATTKRKLLDKDPVQTLRKQDILPI